MANRQPENPKADLDGLIADVRGQVEHIRSPEGPDRDAIRGYELIREIHRGGQGVVYLAHQRTTHRNVAIKVLREGPFAGPGERARFEREVQILATLQHPNIVAIHDSGNAAGSFYFVMDYIAGSPWDEWADSLALRDDKTSPSRFSSHGSRTRQAGLLETFIKICDAVNVAHQRGVIHRDLKPTNIRISVTDEPFVLDFGLAKLTSPDASTVDAPLLTATGQFLGTLPWASPEQVDGSNDHADIRTDVYALGLLLYRALTGRMPYSIASSVVETVRVITQVEPSRPRAWVKDLDEDLETIVLKCLHKDPERRYQTAGEIQNDLQRYLHYEPIGARPESGWYLLRMFAKRHRVAVGMTAAFAAVLVCASILLAYLYVRATANESLANRRAEEITQVAEFQASLLRDVDAQTMGTAIAAEIRKQVGAGLGATWLVDGDGPPRKRSADEVEVALEQFEAHLQEANFADVARHVLDVGMLASAESAIGEEFSEQPATQAALILTLGEVYQTLGRLDSAERHYRSALEIRQTIHGGTHEDVADAMYRVAIIQRLAGDFDEAEKLLDSALGIARSVGAVPLMASILNEQGELLIDRGDYAGAETILRESQTLHTEIHGDFHANVAKCVHDRAKVARMQGDLERGQSLQHQAVEMYRQLLGDNHVDTITSLHNLATSFHRKGEYREAERLYRRVLAARRLKYGNEHPHVASTLGNLAALMTEQNQLDEAERLHRESQAVMKATHADERPWLANSLNNLGMLLATKGDAVAGERMCRRALALRRELLGNQHADVGMTLNNLAYTLTKQRDLEEAERVYLEALELFRELPGPQHALMGHTLVGLGWILKEQNRLDEAELRIRDGLAVWKSALGEEHPAVAQGLAHLGRVLYLRGDDDQAAEANYRAALEICNKKLPPTHLVTARCKAGLGRVLTRQEHFADGEPLLLEAEKIISEAPNATQKHRRDVLEGLVEVYRGWHADQPGKGFDDKAAEWETRLEKQGASTDERQ